MLDEKQGNVLPLLGRICLCLEKLKLFTFFFILEGKKMKKTFLMADMGGTNIRFAIFQNDEITAFQTKLKQPKFFTIFLIHLKVWIFVPNKP